MKFKEFHGKYFIVAFSLVYVLMYEFKQEDILTL